MLRKGNLKRETDFFLIQNNDTKGKPQKRNWMFSNTKQRYEREKSKEKLNFFSYKTTQLKGNLKRETESVPLQNNATNGKPQKRNEIFSSTKQRYERETSKEKQNFF